MVHVHQITSKLYLDAGQLAAFERAKMEAIVTPPAFKGFKMHRKKIIDRCEVLGIYSVDETNRVTIASQPGVTSYFGVRITARLGLDERPVTKRMTILTDGNQYHTYAAFPTTSAQPGGPVCELELYLQEREWPDLTIMDCSTLKAAIARFCKGGQ